MAIAAVVISHDRIYHFGRFSDAPLKGVLSIRGVDLFFALSGILICTRLLQEEQLRGRISLRDFYIRRLCRIQPASLVYLFVIALLSILGVLDCPFRDILSAALEVRNYFPTIQVDHSRYTSHFWSLSVEEHFYLFLPVFLVFIRRYRSILLIALALAIECWRAIVYAHSHLQFGPFFEFRTDVRAAVIVLSAAIAILLTRPATRAWCVRYLHPSVAIVATAAITVGTAMHNSRFNDTLLTCTYPLVIVSTMLHPQSWMTRMLEFSPLRFLGRISYSLYLWQMLFLGSTVTLLPPHSHILTRIQQTPLRYAGLIAASLLSYYLVELPMIRLGHRIAKPATEGRGDVDSKVSIPGTSGSVQVT